MPRENVPDLLDLYYLRSDPIARAICLLRASRVLLKQAGAPRALDKVRRAIKSAEGARRNAKARRYDL